MFAFAGFNFDSTCAGLSVSAANINLCGGTKNEYYQASPLMTNLSTRRHLGMCTVINCIKNKQMKNDSVFIPLRILPCIFFFKIIIIYANMHVTITCSHESTWQSNNKMADYCTWTLQSDVPGPILCST